MQIVARSERVTLERERDEWRRRAIVAEARVVRLTEALLELRPFASRPCRAVIDAALAEDGGAG